MLSQLQLKMYVVVKEESIKTKLYNERTLKLARSYIPLWYQSSIRQTWYHSPAGRSVDLFSQAVEGEI